MLELLSTHDYQNSGLYETDWYKRLQQHPASFVDVGARKGSQIYLRPFKEICGLIGFDADANVLDDPFNQEKGWSSLEILPFCIWAENSRVTLNITDNPLNCSILRPNKAFLDRYGSEGFSVIDTIDIEAITLDEFASQRGEKIGEILKIDAQGGEMHVLSGASKTIDSVTSVIIAEVQFLPAYAGVPLFSEIETHLRKAGFDFFGFIDHNYRSTKKINKKTSLQRERFFHADAVFFRDITEKRSGREIDLQLLMAIALSYYDFAIELVDKSDWCSAQKANFKTVVHSLSKQAGIAFSKIFMSQVTSYEMGVASIMKQIDLARDFATYSDVKL